MDELVFVYGTLKVNESNHHWLKNSKFVRDDKTTKEYLLYDFGAFPCMIKSRPGKNIRGQVFKINEETLECLDRLECVRYGLYERVRVNLIETREPVWGYLYCEDVSQLSESGTFWSGRGQKN